MLDAIDVLKGVCFTPLNMKFYHLISRVVFQVLAFEELSSAKNSPTSVTFTDFPTSSLVHARATSQPLLSSSPKPARIMSTIPASRPRAPSDPFIDNPAPSTSSRPAGRTSQAPQNTLVATESLEEPPNSVVGPLGGDAPPATTQANATFEDADKEYLRTWTSPDLPNPEFISLLKVFPAFITRRPLPRFPVTSDFRRPPDIEEGEDDPVEGKEIRFGTGSMWVSSKQRSDGFEGGWWTRFLLWWRKLFC
jgi:hypothetical protein